MSLSASRDIPVLKRPPEDYPDAQVLEMMGGLID